MEKVLLSNILHVRWSGFLCHHRELSYTQTIGTPRPYINPARLHKLPLNVVNNFRYEPEEDLRPKGMCLSVRRVASPYLTYVDRERLSISTYASSTLDRFVNLSVR